MRAPVVALPLPEAPTEQAMLDGVLDALAGAFAEAGDDDLLLVVSEDAGSATALQFWRAALATGVALASPAAFPWCLANAPAATLSRRFGLRGPNLSWLVDECGEAAAYAGAAAWLAEARASGQAAWVVALRLAPPGRIVVRRWATPAAIPAPPTLSEELARAWRAAESMTQAID